MIDLANCPRIALIGCPGSGKSTLARQIAEKTGHPVIHLDYQYWQPGWVPVPKDEFRAMQEQWVRSERWIIDGFYGGTLELRFAAADLVIFLDLPRLLCAWRVIRRNGTPRPDLRPGLEQGEGKLSKDYAQFCWTILRNRRKDQRLLRALHEKYPGVAFLRLRTRRAVRAFWEGCL